VQLPAVMTSTLSSQWSSPAVGQVEGAGGTRLPREEELMSNVRREHFHFQDPVVVICLRIRYYDYCKCGVMRQTTVIGWTVHLSRCLRNGETVLMIAIISR
jgi:hypothetical protein